jgi:hypothetical protein
VIGQLLLELEGGAEEAVGKGRQGGRGARGRRQLAGEEHLPRCRLACRWRRNGRPRRRLVGVG